MAKRNSLCKKTVDLENGTVSFWFTDSDTVTFNIGDLDDAGLKRAALHGISQKGGDSYAGVKTVKEAQENLVKTLAAVEKGDWSTRAPGEPRTAVLVESLARAAGKTLEQAQKVIDGIKDFIDSEKTVEENAEVVKEKLKALNADPAVKKAKAELAMEKASKEAEESESVLGSLF